MIKQAQHDPALLFVHRKEKNFEYFRILWICKDTKFYLNGCISGQIHTLVETLIESGISWNSHSSHNTTWIVNGKDRWMESSQMKCLDDCTYKYKGLSIVWYIWENSPEYVNNVWSPVWFVNLIQVQMVSCSSFGNECSYLMIPSCSKAYLSTLHVSCEEK